MYLQSMEAERNALQECVEMAMQEVQELKQALATLQEEHETTLMQLHCMYSFY